MHLQTQHAQGKYLTVLKGEILDVCIDLRKNSRTFGKYFKINISDRNGVSIYIPPGFAHGFLGLKKDDNIISYHCTNYRSEKNEIGIIWNDKNLKLNGLLKDPYYQKKIKTIFRLKIT